MATPFEVVLYSDQSTEYFEFLRFLKEESKRSYQLREFLDSSWKCLFDFIRNSTDVDPSFLRATDFNELGEQSKKSHCKSLAITCVVQTVVQIGLTILHRDREAHLWQSNQNLRVVGLCTGVVSAIAASIADSTTNLVEIGPDFVLLSLRLGLAAERRAASIDHAEETWSVVVSGLSYKIASTLIDEFHNLERTPTHRRVYVSVHSFASITISGPPNVLKKFLSTDVMIPIHKLALPIWGPFHAEHLWLPDLDQIILDSKLWSRTISTSLPFMFPNMKKHSLKFRSLRDLLRNALHGVLQVPIMMEETCQDLLDEAGDRPINITILGSGRLGGLSERLHVKSVSNFPFREQSPSGELRQDPGIGDAIAIVGMAGKFPDAEDAEDLWNIISEGRDLHREIPPSRFDIRSHYDPTGKVKNTSLTPYGCFYDNFDKFDLALFKMSPREAAQTDPMQRLMLITAFMALESAGYYDHPQRPRPKFGTYYGQGGDDYRQTNSSQDVDSNYITGGIRAFGPGRVSYHFGWEGPSMTVDTACSASAVAIHQAVSALRLGECDTALTGGANFLSCSDMFAGLSRAGFLSLTGGCKTLDEDADGYCRADAVATLVLKRLDDAIRDKDNVLGLIRGIETNHAANATSITRPHAETQAALFKSVIKSASLTIDDIDHIEMHGTGTQAGDLAETNSIASLLEGRRRPDNHPLFLGAVKPNVGHSEAASGVTSVMKGVLMLQKQVIPRFTGVKNRLNPKLPSLQALNIRLPNENLPYIPINRSKKRRMLINNFNATGGSTALILEEFHQSRTTKADPRDHFPITLSGATTKSLSGAIEALYNLLIRNPNIELSHLSYTLTARRMHHAHRFSCTAATISELASKLKTAVTNDVQSLNHAKAPTVVLVFTGQSSNYAGMGHLLWKTCRTFRNHIESTDLLSQRLGFQSFLPLIQNSENDEQQFSSVQNQLALVALEVSLAHTLDSWGINASAVIGHSLGEYSALTVAGVLSLADTLYLVGKRAQLMLDKCEPDHSMLAVAASEDEVRGAISTMQLSNSTIACYNGPRQIVVSGPVTEVELLQGHLSQKTIKSTLLKTDFAFHSAQIDPILGDFKQTAAPIEFRPPQIPISSTLLGTVAEAGTEAVFNTEYLIRQAREPVRFAEALKELQSTHTIDQSTLWVELGPTSTCLSMVTSSLGIDKEHLASMLDKNKTNWQSTSDVLSKIYRSGGDVFWDKYHQQYLDCLEFIDVPAYCFDLTSHFIQYEGDWMITKNQKTRSRSTSDYPIRSATVHTVEDYTVDESGREMHFATDVLREDFQALMIKHDATKTVSGATWLLADMVATAASYLWQRERPKEALPAIDISPVVDGEQAMKALHFAETTRLVATQHWSSSQSVEVSVIIGDPQSQHKSEYKVLFDTRNEWSKAADKVSYLYQSRIDHFEGEVRHGMTKEIKSDLTTQLLADSCRTETVATIRLNEVSSTFAIDPIWHKELVDVVGRVFKYSTECSKLSDYEFCSWGSLRLLRKIKPATTYFMHARLQPVLESDPILSDIHILDANRNAVAILEDVKYYGKQCTKTMPTTHSSQETSPFGRSIQTHIIEGCKSESDATWETSTNVSSVDPPGEAILDFDRIIALVAEELGVDPSSIREDSLFVDLGIDSIFQIAITAKLREHLQRDLPNSLLVENGSFRELRTFFDGLYKVSV